MMPHPSTADYSREDWIGRLRGWNIRPSRGKGQNFLVDSEVVERIVESAHIVPGETVVEVGPGMGILTGALIEHGAVVHAIELDDSLAPRLQQLFREVDAFTLHHDNAATINLSDILGSSSYKVVANLPYSVAALIIRHFLESRPSPHQLTVMVQTEVAERMCATDGGMSLLTLAIQLFARPEMLFDVPRESFHPEPKVSSSVVQMDVRERPLLDGRQRERLFQLATIAFQQRRKTLLNSLSRGLDKEKAVVSTALDGIGIDPGERPQAIPLEKWLHLANDDLLLP